MNTKINSCSFADFNYLSSTCFAFFQLFLLSWPGEYVRRLPADAGPGVAISRRTGSKAERIMASGVSSTMISIPVAASSALMLRPSRPMIRPFISSFNVENGYRIFHGCFGCYSLYGLNNYFLCIVTSPSWASSIISLMRTLHLF